LNKETFIANIALKTGKTKKESATDVDAFLQTLKEALISDGCVKFIGDFSLEKIDTKARVGRNPADGSEINIPAGKKLKLKVGKTFKDEILG